MQVAREYIRKQREALIQLEEALATEGNKAPEIEALKLLAIQNEGKLNNLQGAVNDIIEAINKLAGMQQLEWAQDLRQWQKKADDEQSPKSKPNKAV